MGAAGIAPYMFLGWCKYFMIFTKQSRYREQKFNSRHSRLWRPVMDNSNPAERCMITRLFDFRRKRPNYRPFRNQRSLTSWGVIGSKTGGCISLEMAEWAVASILTGLWIDVIGQILSLCYSESIEWTFSTSNEKLQTFSFVERSSSQPFPRLQLKQRIIKIRTNKTWWIYKTNYCEIV